MKVGASWKMARKWRLMHHRSFPGRVFQSICLFAWARCYILPISNTVSSFAWPGHGSCCWSLWRFSRYPHKRPLLSTSAMPVSCGMQVDPNLKYLKRFTTHASNLFNYTHIIPITYPSHTHTITCHIQETERNRSLLPSACHQPGSVPGPLRDHGWQLVPPALVRHRMSLVVLKGSSCPSLCVFGSVSWSGALRRIYGAWQNSWTSSGWYVVRCS